MIGRLGLTKKKSHIYEYENADNWFCDEMNQKRKKKRKKEQRQQNKPTKKKLKETDLE